MVGATTQRQRGKGKTGANNLTHADRARQGARVITAATCSFIKSDQSRCQARCIKGRKFCFFHDPKTRKQHIAASVKGANTRNRLITGAATKPGALSPDTPDATLVTGQDVRSFIADTLNKLRTGKIAVGLGLALFQGSGILLKAIEGSDLEQRIEAMEQRQQARSR